MSSDYVVVIEDYLLMLHSLNNQPMAVDTVQIYAEMESYL